MKHTLCVGCGNPTNGPWIGAECGPYRLCGPCSHISKFVRHGSSGRGHVWVSDGRSEETATKLLRGHTFRFDQEMPSQPRGSMWDGRNFVVPKGDATIDKPDNMETVPTWQATIYVGLQEHYDGPVHAVDEIAKPCHDYCDEIGLCVTITPLQFVYSRGGEPGVAVGLINYPRFPKEFTNLKVLTLELAEKLRRAMGQYRVSVVMPNETIMLGEH